MSKKIFENDLVVVRQTKVIKNLRKPADVGMCTLYLRKVLMYLLR